jgi:hypothetical protein
VFQTFYKSSATSLTLTFLPSLKKEPELNSNYFIIVGDRDGEIYFLDGNTLLTRFHIGFLHSHLVDDDSAEGTSTLHQQPMHKQGITYQIRGRLPENVEQDSGIIWSVQADSTRLFSGDSNGKLVIHDFWKYESQSESKPTTNDTYRNVNLKLNVNEDRGVQNVPLYPESKRSKIH